MRLIEPIVLVIADIDNELAQSLGRYRCNNSFALCVVEEVMSENLCGVVKGANGVGVLMRFTVMAKFNRSLDLEDVCGD